MRSISLHWQIIFCMILGTISGVIFNNIGFIGIILFKISRIEFEVFNFDVSKDPALLMVEAPTPGSIVFAKNNPIKMAIKLVDI